MRTLACLLTVALLGLASPPARADDIAAKRQAKKLLGEGDALFAKGSYDAALDSYQKAYDAFPSTKIYYPMAQAEEKLGKIVEAIEHYEKLIAETPDLNKTLATEAEDKIAELAHQVAEITFVVRPGGATVSLDRRPLGTAPLGKPVRLMPGPHTLSVLREGYKGVERTIEVKADERRQEVVRLEVLRVEPVERGTTTPKGHGTGRHEGGEDTPGPLGGDQGGEEGGGGRGMLAAGLVVTGLLAASAATTGILAMQCHAVYADTTARRQDREDNRKRGLTFAHVTDGLLIGTVAVAAFTTTWYFMKVKPSAGLHHGASDEESSRLWVPWVDSNGGGVALVGRF